MPSAGICIVKFGRLTNGAQRAQSTDISYDCFVYVFLHALRVSVVNSLWEIEEPKCKTCYSS
jgi:hypothetical protein